MKKAEALGLYAGMLPTWGNKVDNTATIYPGTQYRQPLQLFHNVNGMFKETTSQMSGLAQKLIVGRGLAVGDLSNSGHMNAVITNLDGPPLLLRNGCQNANHWLTLRLIGTHCNRDAYGAQIVVEAAGRTQVLQVSNAGSFLAASDPRVHIGLGKAVRADKVRIRWPDGHEDVFTNIAADQLVHLAEGSTQINKVFDPPPDLQLWGNNICYCFFYS